MARRFMYTYLCHLCCTVFFLLDESLQQMLGLSVRTTQTVLHLYNVQLIFIKHISFVSVLRTTRTEHTQAFVKILTAGVYMRGF